MTKAALDWNLGRKMKQGTSNMSWKALNIDKTAKKN